MIHNYTELYNKLYVNYGTNCGLQLDTLFGRPKKYGSAGTSGGISSNGVYSSGGSTYSGGSRSLPRINSDNDISTGLGHNDMDECANFVENLDVEVLNDKFEEMLVIILNSIYLNDFYVIVYN